MGWLLPPKPQSGRGPLPTAGPASSLRSLGASGHMRWLFPASVWRAASGSAPRVKDKLQAGSPQRLTLQLYFPPSPAVRPNSSGLHLRPLSRTAQPTLSQGVDDRHWAAPQPLLPDPTSPSTLAASFCTVTPWTAVPNTVLRLVHSRRHGSLKTHPNHISSKTTPDPTHSQGCQRSSSKDTPSSLLCGPRASPEPSC